MRPRPAVGAVGAERAPVLAIAQIGGRFSGGAALRLHAAAGHQLAEHLTEHWTPLVHCGRTALCVYRPLGRVAADSLGELLGNLGKQNGEPSLAPWQLRG